MSAAYHFGRMCKVGFRLSPEMYMAGDLGTQPLPKKKKKKRVEPEAEKSAAFLFGLWCKQADGPLSNTGTTSLANPGQTPQPQTMTTGSQLPNTPKPPAPLTPPKPNMKNTGEPTWGQFGYEFAQNFNPWNGRPKGTGYGNVLDRWYNPWTKQTSREKGEQGLMRAGQVALGTGAAALAAAGGVVAGAPALAATPVTQVPGAIAAGITGNTAAGLTAGGAGAGMASQNPTVQQMFPTFTNALSTMGNAAGQVSNFANNAASAVSARAGDVAYRANDLKQRVWDQLPNPVKTVGEWYGRNVHEPLEHSTFNQATNPISGASNVMHPIYTSGDPTSLLPNSVTLPYEAAHNAVHALAGAEH